MGEEGIRLIMGVLILWGILVGLFCYQFQSVSPRAIEVATASCKVGIARVYVDGDFECVSAGGKE